MPRYFTAKHSLCAARLLAVGFADDHAHVLARYPTDCAVATLVQSLKGCSSREINRDTNPSDLALYWQDGSWAESCGPSAVPGLVRYIGRQRQHHAYRNPPEPWELALFPSE